MARPLAELAYRLAGIVAIILVVRMTPEAATALAWDFTTPDGSALNRPLILAGHLLPVVLLVSGGLFLFFGSSRLARTFPSGGETARSLATPADIHAILLSTAGIVLLGFSLSAFPNIVYNIAVLSSAFAQGFPPDQHLTLRSTWIWLAGVLLQGGFGVVLIFKGSNLVTLLRRRFDRAPVVVVDGCCPHCGWWFEAAQYRGDAAAFLCGNCRQELPREAVLRRLTRA